MEKRIKLIIEGQDRASAAILGASRSLSAFGGVGRTVLGGFLAWHAIRGVFNGVESVITAVGGAIADTASKGMEFNQQMSKVAAVADTDARSLEQLRMKAMELGRDTVFTSNEAAVALEELVKAGVSVPVILEGAAEAALALASAGDLTLEQSALVMSRVINSFQLGGEQAMLAADTLANAANASATTVHNMGEAMKYAAPLMQSLTSPAYDSATAMTELATATALLSQGGIDASMAGAGLQRMLEGLTPNSEKAKGIMEDLGLITQATGNRFFDAEGNFIGLKDAVIVLDEAFTGLTQEEKMTALEAMFGQRAGRVLNSLLNQLGENTEGWDAMYEAVTDEGGAVETAAVKLDNLRGRLEFLKGSLEFIQTAIWTEEFERRLTGPFERLGEVLNLFGQRITGWDIQSTLYVIADSLAKLGEVAIDQIAPKIMDFLNDFGKEETRVAIRDLAEALEDLIITITGGERQVDPSIEGTIALMSGDKPIAAKDNANELVPAITNLTTAIRSFDEAIQKYQALNKWIEDFEKNMIRYQGIVHRWIVNTRYSLNNDMVNAWTAFVNHPIWAKIESTPSRIRTAWNKDVNTLKEWMVDAGNRMYDATQVWSDNLAKFFYSIPGRLADEFRKDVAALKKSMSDNLQAMFDTLSAFDFSSAAATAAGTVIAGFTVGLSGGIGAVVREAGRLAGAAVAEWKRIWDSRSPSKVAYGLAKDWVGGITWGWRDSMPSYVEAAAVAARVGVQSFADAIKGATPVVMGNAKGLVTSVVTAFEQAVQSTDYLTNFSTLLEHAAGKTLGDKSRVKEAWKTQARGLAKGTVDELKLQTVEYLDVAGIEEPVYSHGSKVGEEYTTGVEGGVEAGEQGILESIEALWSEFLDDMESRMEDFKAWMRQQGEEAGKAFSDGLAGSITVPDLPGNGATPEPDEGEYGHGSQPGDPLESPWQSAPPGGSRDPWGANPVHPPTSAPPGGSRDPHPDYPNRPATTVNVFGLGYREATDLVAQRVTNDSRPVFRNEYGVL